jgi:tetratricopeptide (TPR) repeat protein/tRNA A-37 threonylcarbamoyl transferase component Bud32/TolB-like protein
MARQRPDDWKRVREIFEEALAEPAERRQLFVADACRDDPAIQEQVAGLLASHEHGADFLESPAVRLLGDDAPAGLMVDPWTESIAGRVIGSYCIESCVGHGGMGTVYLARRADGAFERRVAIKMIRRGLDSELVTRRFQHERQILASLDHPHIARLFDGGTTAEGQPYFVMEYVEGTPIDRYADDHRLDTRARVELFLRVLDAVQHAHDRHVVHRDLKPSNVLVTASGAPKLLDFGIAKLVDPDARNDSTLTSLGLAMTPDYASPEQVRGEPVTPATDVYALGLLLYELLTGHRPYRLATRTRDEIARIVCEENPPRPSARIGEVGPVPPAGAAGTTTTPETVGRTREESPEVLRQRLAGALDAIVLKALRKEPSYRYESVAALADDLRRHLDGRPVSAVRDAFRYRAGRLARRHRRAAAVAAVLALVSTATAVVIRQTAVVPRQMDAAGNATTPAAATQPRPSVAVIAFRNLSAAPRDAWLSTAMAEMLTTELGGDGQLRVIPSDRIARIASELVGPGDDADEAYERLRTSVGADYLVAGAFVVVENSSPRSLRIDARVHRGERDPVAVAGVGEEAALFALVAEAGRGLRAQLGLKESAPEATVAARAAYPRSLEATKLYAEGLARLRVLDAVAARELLEGADAAEPRNPLIQSALASTWTVLGYDRRAADAAQEAFDASAGLTREDRLNVEGRLAEAQQNWPKAIDVYRTLWGFFSDNAEYGLRLASVQTSSGRAREALETLAAIRRLPAPQGQDPRIDLAEGEAASALGEFKQELEALQRSIRAAQAPGLRLLLARATLHEGRSYYNQGQPLPAEQSMRSAQAMFAEVGDQAGLASALNSLAAVLADRDDRGAARLYEQALATSEAIGDRRGMSAALNNLGIELKDRREFEAARRAHERSLALRREIGHRNWEAVSLSNIGVVLFEQDRFDEAGRYYRASLEICREIGDKRGLVRALHNLAVVDRETGGLSEARKSLEESLAVRREIGDRRGMVVGSVELGMVLLAQGEIEDARRVEEDAVVLARETGLKAGESQALFYLGQIAIVQGDFGRARSHHERALVLRREMNATRTVAESETALAALDLEENRPAEAERRASAVLKGLGPSPAGPLPMSLRLIIARARLATGDLGSTERLIGDLRRTAGQTERIEVRTSLAMVDAELSAARGRIAEARASLTSLRTSLAPLQMTLADLEARLLLLRISASEGAANISPDAAALAGDARARGADLIVRRVEALQKTSKPRA